jgi:hypothetical protein
MTFAAMTFASMTFASMSSRRGRGRYGDRTTLDLAALPAACHSR